MTDTELQFDNIIPQNLKDNETIYKLLKLYNSSFGDLADILENPLNLLDTNFLIKKYEDTADIRFDNVRREIFKIHLQEIFQTFEEISDSEEIYNKFKSIYESLNVPIDDLKIVADIDKSINSQYLNASKSFKTKKGTKSGFFFVYDIINRAGIQAINANDFFNLIEGTKENPNTPYEYTVETSLYKEVYNKTVVPLAHPVGFKWNFIRLLFQTMEDYFGLEQIKTFGETTLTCYGSDQAAIKQIEIINSGIYGSVKDFLVSEDQDKNEQVIIDYNPLDGSEGNGIRFVKEFNGRIILYDRQSVKELKHSETNEIQYLEIEEVRLVEEHSGLLIVNKIERELLGKTFEVIESIAFKEYTIINKDSIEVEFRIMGDFEDKWNTAKLALTNKVVSKEIKFYEPEIFDRQLILDSSSSYNGRIIEDKGNNCLLRYRATYSYKVSTKDVSSYIKSIRPYSLGLETDVTDININQSEYDIAISEGKDPYKDLYATHDHTVEETNWYDRGDNWGRLDYGNYKLTGNIGETNINPIFNVGHISSEIVIDETTKEITYIPDGKIIDLTIGGDWILTDSDIHDFDKGFNPNSEDGARWEQYYRPKPEADLLLINSTNTVERYERDNTEWYGDTTIQWNYSVNNTEYIAWEDFNMDEEIQIFNQEQEYILDDKLRTIPGKLVNADPVNLQPYTTEQISIGAYIPLKDAWTRVNNNLSLFNIRDLQEADVGDVPVIDNWSMVKQWNSELEIFGINGEVAKDNINITNTILCTSATTYNYNTFTAVYIGDELLLSNTVDFIDGKGVTFEAEADTYRVEWNVHDDDLVTTDNVISGKFEVYGMKVYRQDDKGNWIYIEDNNITSA